MTLLPMPPTVKAFGNKVVVFLEDAPAAVTGIPTTTETNAGIFSSLHLYTPFNVQPTQNTGEGPRKLGSKTTPTELGTVTYPAVEIQYSYNPQAADTAGGDGNELYDVLKEGTILTAVVFDGLNGEKATVSTGDVADIWLIECGVQRKGQTGEGEYDHVSVTQSLRIVGGEPVKIDHALAAS